jgi:carbon storage regulator
MMLILTPKLGESIMIGDDIKVMIISDKRDQVKVGIEAPDDVDIWREEIYDNIQNQQKS